MIAYAMFDAMNPDSMKHLAKGINKDQFVQDKINNVISLQYLLWEICKIKIVKRGQTVWNLIPISKSLPPEVQSEHLTSQQKVRRFDPHNPAWSRYEMDHDSFEKAMRAFARIYPSVFEVLEKTRMTCLLKFKGTGNHLSGPSTMTQLQERKSRRATRLRIWPFNTLVKIMLQ